MGAAPVLAAHRMKTTESQPAESRPSEAKPAVYQVFDLFGSPVYFTDLDKTLTDWEAKLDAYPVYDLEENFEERKGKNNEYKFQRQQYRHLLNQLYAIKGLDIRIRGEVRFTFPSNPDQVIHASVLQQLDDSTLLLRYWTPRAEKPMIQPVNIQEVRILNLMFHVNPEPTCTHLTGAKSRHWRAMEARTVMPMMAN